MKIARKGSVKKIAILTNELFDNRMGGYGGFGFTSLKLAYYFDSISYDVVVIVDHEYNNIPERVKSYPFEVIFMPNLQQLYQDSISNVRELLSHQLDLIITIDFLINHELPLTIFATTPVLIYHRDPRGMDEYSMSATLKDNLRANFCDSIDEYMSIPKKQIESFRRINMRSKMVGRRLAFAANGEFLVAKAKRKLNLPRMNVHQLYNPVKIPEVSINHGTETKILFMGRLEPIKRPWIALEVAKRMPDCNFLIAGSSVFPDMLDEIITPYKSLRNVSFLGIVHGKEKEHLFSECLGLLNTSLHEGLPVTFLEAFAYGKPVISSMNPNDLVSRFGYYCQGTLTPQVDNVCIDTFVSQIRRCIVNKDERKEKGAKAREYILNNHTFEVFNKQFNRICNEEFNWSIPIESFQPGITA